MSDHLQRLCPWLLQRNTRLWIAAVLVLGALIYFVARPAPDGISVPLGVEQAAIVTYGGPLLAVAPYKWGVAVNVRIAEVSEREGQRVYDVRYIVNRGGTFDLKDYVVASDGSALVGLPTFKFTGDPKLSKNLDTRIQETEEIRVDVGGRYYETMAVLAVLWIGWLLLLIFWKRPKPPAAPDAGPPAPTLIERLSDYLALLGSGNLDAAAKAKMELTMLQCWRDDLGLNDMSIGSALSAIGSDARTGVALGKLQRWLHHPDSKVDASEIVAMLKAQIDAAARA